MKILQANKFFFKNGGSETVMFQERDYLTENGHEVIDFSMRDDRNFDSKYSSYFVENKSYAVNKGKLAKAYEAASFIHSNEAVSKISRLISDTKPDLVHCHNIYHQLTPSIIGAAKKLNVTVVLTLHDSKVVCPSYYRVRDGKPCSECLTKGFSNVIKHRCADSSLGKSSLLYAEAIVQKFLGNYEQVDAFIAPSRFMRESISHRIPENKIELLYNGVDLNNIDNSQQKDDGYVLYLGRLVQEKGIETLLKAHSSANGSWNLVVAGTGPLLDVLKTQYNPSIFVGYLSGELLKQTISKASVVVVPSEIYENCSMTVLEGMAYGKPVVGSKLGGTKELIDDGYSGFLFEAGDVNGLVIALTRLMNDKPLRSKMGRLGRQRVEQYFSLEKHHQGLMNIYEKLLGAK